MQRLLVVFLAVCLWIGFVLPASADVAGLTPCVDSPAFQQRAATAKTEQAKARFARYSHALCGDEGLPHLIADGRFSHVGDFTIPSILFLYIAGAIGWSGRAYLQAIKKAGDAEQKEIILDVPLAVNKTILSGLWPLLAIQELLSGQLTAKDSEITVSPR